MADWKRADSIELHIASTCTCLKGLTLLCLYYWQPLPLQQLVSQVKHDFIKWFWETGKKATMGMLVQKLPTNK